MRKPTDLTIKDLINLPKADSDAYIKSLSREKLDYLLYSWKFKARDSQLPPKEWGKDGCFIWNIRAGRGWGKTVCGSEVLKTLVETGNYKYSALAGATAGDVQRIQIYGPSGIMQVCSPNFKPVYKAQKMELVWPNGAITYVMYGSDREAARGNNIQLVWCDEVHKWQYPEEAFENIMMALRLKIGDAPLLCINTSTPKPTKFTRELESRKDKQGRPCTITTTGTTYENLENLSETYTAVIFKHEGTRLGEQELNAQIMDDNPGALFKREWISRDRVSVLPRPDQIRRVIVGVDPAASHKSTSNHTGIILIYEAEAPKEVMSGNKVRNTEMTHYYIVRDDSIVGTPLEWGTRVKMLTEEAGCVVIEDNQGGDMVESTLVNAGVKVRIERVHAVKDKGARAMPVSTIMQQGRIHFYRDLTTYVENEDPFMFLEDELCNWIPGNDSPDRMDAMVHAINFCEPDTDDRSKNAKYYKMFAHIR